MDHADAESGAYPGPETYRRETMHGMQTSLASSLTFRCSHI